MLRPHYIAIGLYNRDDSDADGGALVRTHRVEVEVAGPRTPVPDLAGLPQPDLLLLNDDDLGYAIVRFDERSLATLTTSIGAFRDGLARTVCWSAVMDMAAQAELSVPAFVKIVTAGMGHEPSVSVLQQLHRVTAQRISVWPTRRGHRRASGNSPPRASNSFVPRNRAATTSSPGRSCSAGPRPPTTSSTCWPGCLTAASRSRG